MSKNNNIQNICKSCGKKCQFCNKSEMAKKIPSFDKTKHLIEECDKIILGIDKASPTKDDIMDALFCHIILQFGDDFDKYILTIYESHQKALKNIKRQQDNDTIEEYLKKVQQSWKNTHDIHNILLIFGIKPAQNYFNHIDYQTIKPFLDLRNSLAHHNVMLIDKTNRQLFYSSIKDADIIECAQRFIEKIDKEIKEIITSLQSF